MYHVSARARRLIGAGGGAAQRGRRPAAASGRRRRAAGGGKRRARTDGDDGGGGEHERSEAGRVDRMVRVAREGALRMAWYERDMWRRLITTVETGVVALAVRATQQVLPSSSVPQTMVGSITAGATDVVDGCAGSTASAAVTVGSTGIVDGRSTVAAVAQAKEIKRLQEIIKQQAAVSALILNLTLIPTLNLSLS